MAKLTGKTIVSHRAQKSTAKPNHSVTVVNGEAAELARLLYPYLRLKRKQARLVMDLAKFRVSCYRAHNPEKTGKFIFIGWRLKKLHSFYYKAQQLNKRGV